MWISPAPVHPSIAAQVLAQAEFLRSLLAQYQPIRDQAEVRSEEQMRADSPGGVGSGNHCGPGRNGAVLVHRPATGAGLKPRWKNPAPVPELAPVAVADVGADNLVVDIGVAASDIGVAVSNDALAVEQTPIVEAQPVQLVKEAPAPVAAGAAQGY